MSAARTRELALWASIATSTINTKLARSIASEALHHTDPNVRAAARALLQGSNR